MKNLNRQQRILIALSVIIFLLIVLVHNPIDGYKIEQTESWTSWEPISERCANNEITEAQYLRSSDLPYDSFAKLWGPIAGAEQWSESQKLQWWKDRSARQDFLFKKCFRENWTSKTTYLEFNEWQSNQPLIYWFGSVPHLLESLVVVFCSLLAFFYALRD